MSKADEFYYGWADTHQFYKYAMELEAENAKLKEIIKTMRDVKDTPHTEQAAAAIYRLL